MGFVFVIAVVLYWQDSPVNIKHLIQIALLSFHDIKKKSEVFAPLYLDPIVAISFLIFKYPVSYMKKFWTLNHSLARKSQDKLETTECEASLGKTQLVASLTGCQPSMLLSFQLMVCLSKGFFSSSWAPHYPRFSPALLPPPPDSIESPLDFQCFWTRVENSSHQMSPPAKADLV